MGSTALTTPGIQRTSMVAAEASRAMARAGARRRLGLFLARRTARPPADMPAAPAPPWAGVVVRLLSAVY